MPYPEWTIIVLLLAELLLSLCQPGNRGRHACATPKRAPAF